MIKTQVLNGLRRLLMNEPIERWLHRLVRGREVTGLLSRLPPNHYQYPKPSPREVNRRGFQLELDISDSMDWHLYYDFFEQAHENLLKLCPRGGVALDIGANIGATLLPLASTAGPNGRVFGFEPYQPVFEKCARNLQLNGLTNTTLLPLALGRSPGWVALQVRDERNLGKNAVGAGDEGIPVEVTTLDLFVKARALERLDVIKIDVEGFEIQVLEGAVDTLARFQPDIFIEVSDVNLRRQSSSASGLLHLLRAHGYLLFNAATLAPISLSFSADGQHLDVIARRPGRDF